ncbi:TRAP transporter small permease subunit [Phaeovulum sp. NW3]|nr:TRAP transporter small permease subunit [Phaeovulum sp. NW3]
MSVLARYLVAQDGLSDLVGRAISWLTLVMIGALVWEIGARYFLNAPTVWAHELSTMLYGGFCILAGSYTLRHQGHVRSEVVYGLLPPRARAACDVVVYVLALMVLVVFLDMAIDFAATSWAAREYSARSIWQPPLYPFKTVLPVAVGLLALQVVAELLRALLRLAGRDDERLAPRN